MARRGDLAHGRSLGCGDLVARCAGPQELEGSAMRRIDAWDAVSQDEDAVDAWEFQEDCGEVEYVSTVYGIVPSRSWQEYRQAVAQAG